MSLLIKAVGVSTFAGLEDTPSSYAAQASKGLRVNAGETALELIDREAALEFIIDGGGTVISTGVKGYLRVPFDCTVIRASLLASPSGDIKVDIWKDTYANFPPTDGDSICGGNELEIASGTKDQDATLTSWSTSLSEGDILAYNVDSVDTIELCSVILEVEKS